MGAFEMLKINSKCVICSNVAGLLRSNSPVGPICPSCMSKLRKHKISIYSISTVSFDRLLEICGIDTQTTENTNI